MISKFTGQRGMSLVEVTIILMVLSIVTAVLSPSIADYVDDARQVKAKEDVEAIGVSVARLIKDTGYPFMVESGAVTLVDRFKMANRADLAFSTGNIPVAQSGVDNGMPAAATAIQGAVAWDDTIAETSGKVSLYNQLVANTPAYTDPTTALTSANPAAPGALGKFGLGWRGAYLSGIVTPDPWGFRYVCNTVFLGAATDATATNGGAAVGWTNDTVCLSAGRNNQIELNFDTAAGGTTFAGTQNDDVIYVVSGYGR